MNTENIAQNTQSQGEALEIDVRRLIKAIIKNLWKIVIVTVLCGLIALSCSIRFVTPLYHTTTSFYVTNKVLLNIINTDINSSDLATSMHLVDSYVAILGTRDTLQSIGEHSGLDLSYSQLFQMISASSINDTEVLKVTVTSDNPETAAKVADSAAHVITSEISGIVEGSSVKMIEKAIIPKSPYSPNYVKNTIIGLLAGFLLSAGLFVMLELFDTKIKTEENIRSISKHPVLVTVPDMKKSSKRRHEKNHYHRYGYYSSNCGINNTIDPNSSYIGKNVDFATSEAYKLLRTKLQYSLSVDHKCPVFLVSSALPGEGKSTSSINLAYHFAQLNKRVLLIDGDMRRPTLAKKLDLENYPGLSEYLTGFVGLDESLREYKTDDEQMPISVLTGGTTPPNPVELIDSEQMRQAIIELREKFDIIIFDMPPIDDVTDALVLAKYADGVLLVVRHNYCNRSALRNAVNQFEFVKSKILGFVLNCYNENNGHYYTKKYSSGYGKRYGYYHSHNDGYVTHKKTVKNKNNESINN